MIHKYKPFWLPYLKDIDIKCHEFPWFDEDWAEISKYVVKGVIRKVQNDFRVVAFYAVKPGVICTIHKLAVRPNFVGYGIGKELLQDIESECRNWGLSVMEITVHEERKNSVNWLRKQGFMAISTKTKCYPDGRDGIVLRKEL